MLCDGTAATITYTVAADGTLSEVERHAGRRRR